MHISSTSVNSAFTGVAERPVSHIAAVAVLGALGFVAHEGVASLHLGALGSALMILFAALAILQWLALGRREACLAGRDDDRAAAVIQQAILFGVIETALYALGGLALLAREGHDVYHWGGFAVATAAAAGCAWINFRLKWVSCDPVDQERSTTGPTGGQRVHDALFSEPVRDLPALAAPESGNVVTFDIERAIRHKADQERSLLGDVKAALAVEDGKISPAARRLQLHVKRTQTRHRRAAQRTAISA